VNQDTFSLADYPGQPTSMIGTDASRRAYYGPYCDSMATASQGRALKASLPVRVPNALRTFHTDPTNPELGLGTYRHGRATDLVETFDYIPRPTHFSPSIRQAYISAGLAGSQASCSATKNKHPNRETRNGARVNVFGPQHPRTFLFLITVSLSRVH